MALQAGSQNQRIDRLLDVVVGTGHEGFGQTFFVTDAGYKEDWRDAMCRNVADRLAHFDGVEIGQVDVEKERLGPVLAREFECGVAGRGLEYPEAVLLKHRR